MSQSEHETDYSRQSDDGIQEKEVVARAKEGEKPSGLATRQVTLRATITAVDKKKQRVTLKGLRARRFP